MENPDNFLKYDSGERSSSLEICCQQKLKEALTQLADGGSRSTYCRNVLIEHVREEMRAENPRLVAVGNGSSSGSSSGNGSGS
jgi:hypothetical protein